MERNGGILRPSRREVIVAGAAAGAGLFLRDDAPATLTLARHTGPAPLRIAHLTDMHVQPELAGGEGWAACLESVKKIDPQPAFIINGGDHVMSLLDCTTARASEQWDLYFNVLHASGIKLPIYPVIGNHDVFGWSERTPGDPR